MELTAVLGLSVVAALLSVMLKKHQPEQGVLLGLAAGVLFLALSVDRLTPLFRTLRELFSAHPSTALYAPVLLKGVGICLLTQTASDACRDAGETALAGKAELVGKAALLTLALPLFQEVLAGALSLMKGT